MKTTMKRSLLLLAGVCTSLAVTVATPGQALAAAAVQPLPTAWPRDFDSAQQRIELYQPQVEVWQGNRIEGRGFCGRCEERHAQLRRRAFHRAC